MDRKRILQELARILDDDQLIASELLAKIDGMLWILYPRGVRPEQYADLIRVVRVLDRLCQWQEQAETDARDPTPQPIDDDNTAPIVNPQLFAESARPIRDSTWAALARGTLGGAGERDPSSHKPYTSIFKAPPNDAGRGDTEADAGQDSQGDPGRDEDSV